MATYTMTGPDGKDYSIDGPAGATPDQVATAIQAQLAGQPKPATPEPRSFLGDLGHQAGLAVRAGVQGLASLPAMASDAVTGPINAGLDAVAGEGNGFRFQSAQSALGNLMTAAGVATPENAAERVVQDVGSGVVGAGSMVGAGKLLANTGGAVAKGVGNLLASGPGLQLGSAATGTAASGLTREGGGGEGAQLAAGLIGGVLPGVLPSAVKAGVRGALRGGEQGRQAVADVVDTFEAAGTTPTLGQAVGGNVQRVESITAKMPGGSGVMAQRAQQQIDDMSTAVQKLSDELAPEASAVKAGEAIERGVKAFKNGFKTVQNKLYATLDEYIPPNSRVEVSRTQEALESLNKDIPGSPELSKWFKNARIQGIEIGLKSDVGSPEAVLTRPGMAEQASQLRTTLEDAAAKTTQQNVERQQLRMANMAPVMSPAQIEDRVQEFLKGHVDDKLTYTALKKLRTLVGDEIADNSLMSTVPRSKWRALYAAMSEDLGDAAKQAGPKAEKAWEWANQYTHTQMNRLEQMANIVAKDSPEKIFSAATSGTSEGDTIVRRVISMIPKSERREVAAAVLQRMGRATPGQQNAERDAFSSETFLTNLNKLSLPARKTIFGRTDVEGIYSKVEQLADVAASRREGGKIFANPSGTAGLGAQLVNAGTIGGALATSMVTGNPLPILGAVGVPSVAYGAARLAASPSFVKALARSTTLPAGAAASVLGAASRIDGQVPARSPLTQPALTAQMPRMAPIAAIGSAKNVEEAIAAAQASISGAENQPFQPTQQPTDRLIESRPDGTISIRGDTRELIAALLASGIPATSLMPVTGGVLVGRTHAEMVKQALYKIQSANSGAIADSANEIVE